jgi:hypothetical protein
MMLMSPTKDATNTRDRALDGDQVDAVQEKQEKKGDQYVRIQLSLRPEYAKRLEKLRVQLGLNSYAEVVRYCLRQTEQLVRADPEADSDLYLQHPDGTRILIMR